MNSTENLINQCKTFFVVLLKGPVGAGKTHFVKEYMRIVYDFHEVTSPTFVFLNTYEVQGKIIGHMDCYNKINYDILYETLMYYDQIFIEWPENLNENVKSLMQNSFTISFLERK